MRLALEQVVRGHDQARRAEAALHRAGFDEGFLDRVTIEPFDGDDRAPVGLPGLDEARANQCAVEIHGARSALALLARVLRPIKAESLAQQITEALALPDAVGRAGRAVGAAFDLHAAAQAQVKQRRGRRPRAW